MKIFTTLFPTASRHLLSVSCFLTLFVGGCSNNERVDNSGALANEIKSAKIKRVTATDLTAALLRTGQKAAEAATLSLEKRLPDSIQTCLSRKNATFLDPIRKQTGAEIELLFAGDSSRTDLFPKEKELMEAYAYQAKQNSGLIANLQKINDSLSTYFAPVPSSSIIFKNCEEARESPFAIWRIALRHKEVIKNIEL